MRRLVDEPTLRRFMQTLGEEAEKDVRLYFTGGATREASWTPEDLVP